MKNALNLAKQAFQNYKQMGKNALGTVSSISSAIAPALTQAKHNFRQAVLPHIPYRTQQDYGLEEEAYEQAPLIDRAMKFRDRNSLSVNPEWLALAPGAPESFSQVSAKPMDFYEAPQSDPRYEVVRQKVLNNFSDAYRKYLSQIPIIPENNPKVFGSAYGIYAKTHLPDFDPYTYEPRYISINETLPVDSSQIEETLLHEYLHQAPRPILSRNIEKTVPQMMRSPFLLGLMQAYYGDLKRLPNPEETYATLGGLLGPSVQNNPMLSSYYSGIFNPSYLGPTAQFNRYPVAFGETEQTYLPPGYSAQTATGGRVKGIPVSEGKKK